MCTCHYICWHPRPVCVELVPTSYFPENGKERQKELLLNVVSIKINVNRYGLKSHPGLPTWLSHERGHKGKINEK